MKPTDRKANREGTKPFNKQSSTYFSVCSAHCAPKLTGVHFLFLLIITLPNQWTFTAKVSGIVSFVMPYFKKLTYISFYFVTLCSPHFIKLIQLINLNHFGAYPGLIYFESIFILSTKIFQTKIDLKSGLQCNTFALYLVYFSSSNVLLMDTLGHICNSINNCIF